LAACNDVREDGTQRQVGLGPRLNATAER